VPLAQGDVLEIGIGPGVNFPHYDSARVKKIYALEPNLGMLRRADKQRRNTNLEVEFLDLPGESIPLAGMSVDTVVSTFTLCTIPGVLEAIQGLRRVLKPGGKFIFFEHGLRARSESGIARPSCNAIMSPPVSVPFRRPVSPAALPSAHWTLEIQERSTGQIKLDLIKRTSTRRRTEIDLATAGSVRRRVTPAEK
jgi:SAM-dependent methyltransferase